MPRSEDVITLCRPAPSMVQVTGTDAVVSYRSGHLSPQEWVSDYLERLKKHEAVANAPNAHMNRSRFPVPKTGQMEEG